MRQECLAVFSHQIQEFQEEAEVVQEAETLEEYQELAEEDQDPSPEWLAEQARKAAAAAALHPACNSEQTATPDLSPIFPPPPAFACAAGYGSASLRGEGCRAEAQRAKAGWWPRARAGQATFALRATRGAAARRSKDEACPA